MLMRMFFVAGIGIAIFIEFLLISKKNKSTSDRILTVWMFAILVHLFLLYLLSRGMFSATPFCWGWTCPCRWCMVFFCSCMFRS